jgi:hypothetical protein
MKLNDHDMPRSHRPVAIRHDDGAATARPSSTAPAAAAR